MRKIVCLLLVLVMSCNTFIFAEQPAQQGQPAQPNQPQINQNQPLTTEEMDKRGMQYEEQKKYISVGNEDPKFYPTVDVSVRAPGGNRTTIKVDNKGELDIDTIGKIKVDGRRVSEVQDEIFKRFGYNYTFQILDLQYPVKIMGAVMQPRMIPACDLASAIIQCGGINDVKGDGELYILDPAKGKKVIRDYFRLSEVVKENIWLNPGTIVQAQYRSGVSFNNAVSQWLSPFLNIVQVGLMLGIIVVAANRN